MSKREELRRKRQQEARQRRWMVIAGVALVAVAAAGFLVYQNTRPIGEITTIEKETWPMAEGKALGPKDARVVILEFSDFQ
ncbi:MAG: hypothetical protein FJ030_03930 [Chloroflexi bacterium]|nr:hypothetical protein [Chloroflexota bacterium]